MKEDTANYIACHGITLWPQWVDTSNNNKNNLLHCPQLLWLSELKIYTAAVLWLNGKTNSNIHMGVDLSGGN